MGTLGHNSYGKSNVRLTKVVRNGARHELFEINANIHLEGDFQPHTPMATTATASRPTR
jgi:hypothetical protein